MGIRVYECHKYILSIAVLAYNKWRIHCACTIFEFRTCSFTIFVKCFAIQQLFPYKSSCNISEIWTATKVYIWMLQTSNLAVLLIFSCSFHFWYSQVLKVRVGRSCDQVLHRAHCYHWNRFEFSLVCDESQILL